MATQTYFITLLHNPAHTDLTKDIKVFTRNETFYMKPALNALLEPIEVHKPIIIWFLKMHIFGEGKFFVRQ